MSLPRDNVDELFQQPDRIAFDHYGATATSGAEATGTITCAANTAAADGDSVTISDGVNPAVVYEYDKSANGVTAGHVSWAAGTTAASNATALALLIAANQPELTVVDNLAGVLTLTAKIPGTFANMSITKSGAIASAVTGMAGGTDPGFGVSATTMFAVCTLDTATRFDSIEVLNPTGFVQDASNYWTLALKSGSKTLGSYSTQTSAQGTLTANTAGAMLMNATDTNKIGAAGELVTLVLTKTGTPGNFPTGRVVAHARRV